MALFDDNPDAAKQALIRTMLAQSGSSPDSQGSMSLGTPFRGLPFSGLPFSGLPRVGESSMFGTKFPAARPAMPSPETPHAEPVRPPSMAPIKIGSSLGEGIFERGLKSLENKQPDDKKSNLDAIKDALAASSNALAAYFQQGTPTTSGDDRVTMGAAPGNKFFAAPPRRRILNPLEAPDTGEEAFDMQGIPAGYIERLAGQESGGNDKAVNKLSGASGRFQFMPATVADLVQRVPGLAEKINNNWRTDAAQQDALLRAYTQISLDTLKPIVKDRMPTMGELYAMHFFGHGGGYKALTNPDKKLGELFPDIVFKQNPTLGREMTPAQFVAYINNAWK